MGFHAQYDCTHIGARESNSVGTIRRPKNLPLGVDVARYRCSEILHKALEPMADFTDALSGDSYVTIGSIKCTLRFIKNASKEEADDTRLTADVKAKIQENFKKRDTSDTAQTILNTSTWLDP